MFQVPSLSPTTPDRSRRRANNSSNTFASNPSTTPAGPPPSSFTNISTTPAGPPPSSIFGSVENVPPISFPSYSKDQGKKAKGSPLRFEDRRRDDEEIEYDAMDEDEPEVDFGAPGDERSLVPTSDVFDVQTAARSIAGPPVGLIENDVVIVETQRLMEQLSRDLQYEVHAGYDRESLISATTSRLLGLWDQEEGVDCSATTGIGPAQNSSSASKAIFLASLALPLHHNHLIPRNDPFLSNSARHSQRIPLPVFLLSWLNSHHDPYRGEYDQCFNTQPNPTSHPRFWDTVSREVVRGKIKTAIDLLRAADFSHAHTAFDDGGSKAGYHGKQLENTNRVVRNAIKILESCPGRSIDQSRPADWNVKGSDWAIFRQRVRQANADLESFAEGSSQERALNGNALSPQAENFGMSSVRSDELSLSTRSRKVESRVPWSIYQSLGYIYGQLMGTRAEVMAASADWMEAAILTTIWWDGEEDEAAHENLNASRRAIKRPQMDRLVDSDPQKAYLQKLALSLSQVLDDDEAIEEPDLQVNPVSPAQVGIASILSGDIQSLVRILRGLSATIVTSFVEIARYGGWLQSRPPPSKEMMNGAGFDDSDLMVLSYNRSPNKDTSLQADDLMIRYADLLSEQKLFQDTRLPHEAEGWLLAIQVLGRLDDGERAIKKIGLLLDGIEFTDSVQVERTISLCTRLSLPEQAQQVSLRFAEYNLNLEQPDYGLVLIHYTRANALSKMKELIDILTSTSLIQSTIYPPPSQTDKYLSLLISDPKSATRHLNRLNHNACTALLNHISGYATLRRFYTLRDSLTSHPSQDHQTTPSLQKEAADPLLTLIKSASDPIHGGLYDPSLQPVVPVECLLVLLAEALPLLDSSQSNSNPQHHHQSTPHLSNRHLFTLLKALEDLETSGARIHSATDAFFASALAHYHNASSPTIPSPRDLLKKNPSNLTASSTSGGFSLVGSGLLGSGTLSNAQTESSGGSGVLVKRASDSGHLKRKSSKSGGNDKQEIKRGWDWRAGFTAEAHGSDVVKILRVRIAQEIGAVWTSDE